MKLTIKNLKISEFASHETNCFEATIYVDGRRAFIAENSGQGGPTNFHLLGKHVKIDGGSYMPNPVMQASQKLLDQAEAWAAAQPRIPFGHGLEGDFACNLEYMIDDLVEQHRQLKQLKQQAAKGVAFYENGNHDEIHCYKFPAGTKAARREAQRKAWLPGIAKKHPTAEFIGADGKIIDPSTF